LLPFVFLNICTLTQLYLAMECWSFSRIKC
jgi:hypothetical protein